jgi:hypothetical protein
LTLIEDNASKCSLNYLIDRRVLKDASIAWLNDDVNAARRFVKDHQLGGRNPERVRHCSLT